jgi:hypothetical protein
MADSIREQIFSSIINGLGTISPTLGYVNTIKKVYDPPVALSEIYDYPSINIEDGDEVTENASVGNHKRIGRNDPLIYNQTTIKIDCIMQSTENPRQARNRMKADIQRYFGLNWQHGVALSSIYQGSIPWVVDKGSSLTGITMNFIIYYRQRLESPDISK